MLLQRIARKALSTATVSASMPLAAPIAVPAETVAVKVAASANANAGTVPAPPRANYDSHPDWTPSFAVPEKCNSIFKLPAATLAQFAIKNSSTSATKQITKSLASTGYLASLTDTIMLRESWLSLLSLINGELSKEQSKMKIFLDAQGGVGKSTFLNLAATHFKSFDTIVIHLPSVANWISGLEPYDESAEEGMFTQAAFTSTVLSQFFKVNGPLLEKVVVQGKYEFDGAAFSGSLAQLVSIGIDSPKHSHKVLDAFISELLEFPENRPRVLFSFDQVNAFYSKTAYHDTKSNVLLADQLELLRPFMQILARPTLPKAAVICATDRTNGEINSPFLTHLLNGSPAAARDLTDAALVYTPPNPDNLAEFSAFGNAVVPPAVAPALYDPFTFKAEVHPRGVAKFAVPCLQMGEAYALVEGLRRSGQLKVGKVSDEFVQKAVMVTKGNAREVLKYCV
ncbi:mitochondrial ribosomal death-associated protein 3-domain-containing protein [Chytriomyces sp. MP71]|nr:mitochondrial ribosomal death-associated protein 3-domain-containing protein [Chytriomyces sp. MP71]